MSKKEVTAKSAIEAYQEAEKDIKYQRQIEKLEMMYKGKQAELDAHKAIAKVHSAYIAILLKKLGAVDEETAFEILDTEVKQALASCETRGVANNKGAWKLYCVNKG